MDLPEVLLWLFIVFCVAAALLAGLWLLLPVALLAWVMMPAADKVATDVVETSAPGSVPALGCGVLTMAAAGLLVVVALLIVAALESGGI